MAQIEKKNYGLETLCFIFGIASAVMAVVSFVSFVVTITDCDGTLRTTDIYLFNLFFYSLIAVFIIGWFAMCILLCVGICKRKAVFMRAYCVFIIVSDLVILPVTALLTYINSGLSPSGPFSELIVVLVCCVVHVLGLILVYKTIHKIQREQREIEETTKENLTEKN